MGGVVSIDNDGVWIKLSDGLLLVKALKTFNEKNSGC